MSLTIASGRYSFCRHLLWLACSLVIIHPSLCRFKKSFGQAAPKSTTRRVASSSRSKGLPQSPSRETLPPPQQQEHGWSNFLSRQWQVAQAWVDLEQQVEDYNAAWIRQHQATPAQAVRHRRLICLPLDDRFDPPMGVFSHGHVQTGDKMSLPANFWSAIQWNRAQVPWLFSVRRIPGVTSERVTWRTDDPGLEQMITPQRPLAALDRVVGGPLDFRAPSCYIFLPWWMMRSLGVRPLDVVEVELIETVAPGSLAKLRPHSSQFAQDIAHPQAVLETELRHYSSLTQGSTIAFDYNRKRYWFDVVELRASPRGDKQPLIKVQDCDIATDFLPSREGLRDRQRKKAAAAAAQQQEEK